MSPRHTVSQLTTASGLKFAFDPTAAQFGWKENLAPWDIYEQRRIDLKIPVTPGELYQVNENDSRDSCASKEMRDMTVRLLRDGGFSDILSLSKTKFVDCLQSLERKLAESVADSAELEDIYKLGV